MIYLNYKRVLGAMGVLSVVLPMLSNAMCPNKCNKHGTCGANDKCSCHTRWHGGDCSQRECIYARSWADAARRNDDAHQWAECSDRGSCNHKTGECECDSGFTGSACRRMVCPNDCSGHGVCNFIEDITKDGTDKRAGGASGRTYQLWDQEKIQGCQCDGGYEGHDCSQRICPKGDDPLTTTGVNMKQLVKITGANNVEFFLTYNSPYGDSWTTGKLTSDYAEATVCADMQTELRKLPNHALKTVTVAKADGFTYARTALKDPYTTGEGASSAANDDGTTSTCVVTFPDEIGATGLQYLLDCNVAAHSTAGMIPKSAGDSSATCTVAEFTSSSVSTLVLTELATCSNRGNCNAKVGECECYAGHKGAACEEQEALV